MFNRPELVEKTFTKVKEIQPSQLFIACDGPRMDHSKDADKCGSCQQLVEEMIDWNCETHKLYRRENLGCRDAVSSAISWFFDNVEYGIILEDDCLAGKDFFNFCEILLKTYQNDKRVMHIGGSNFQFGRKRGDGSYYFSNYNHVWGWATWKRAWQEFDDGMKDYNDFLTSGRLNHFINSTREKKYRLSSFENVRKRQVDTWDYIWTFSIFSNHGISIIPNANLISNIGLGDSATHTLNSSNRLFNLRIKSIGDFKHPSGFDVDRDADRFTFDVAYCMSTNAYTGALIFLKRILRKIWTSSPRDYFQFLNGFSNSNLSQKPSWVRIKKGFGVGIDLLIDPNRFKGWNKMINGGYDVEIFDFIQNRIDDHGERVVWDCGAHFGFSSLVFAQMVGEEGRVVSFEPNPYNYLRLKSNVKRNKKLVKRITLENKALSNEEGQTTMIISDDVDGSYSSGSFLKSVTPPMEKEVYNSFEEETVEVSTIDKMLESKTLPVPDIIKFDIEGAEHEALLGGYQLLKRYFPTLIIELHGFEPTYNCTKLLLEMGYLTQLLKIDTGSFLIGYK